MYVKKTTGHFPPFTDFFYPDYLKPSTKIRREMEYQIITNVSEEKLNMDFWFTYIQL